MISAPGDWRKGDPWFLQRLLPTRNQTVDGPSWPATSCATSVSADTCSGWVAGLVDVHSSGWGAGRRSVLRGMGRSGRDHRDHCAGLLLRDHLDGAGRGVHVANPGRKLPCYRYLFQLDSGQSFDGEPIIAQWTSQPLVGPPFYRKFLDRVGFPGRAHGYAAVQRSSRGLTTPPRSVTRPPARRTLEPSTTSACPAHRPARTGQLQEHARCAAGGCNDPD